MSQEVDEMLESLITHMHLWYERDIATMPIKDIKKEAAQKNSQIYWCIRRLTALQN